MSTTYIATDPRRYYREAEQTSQEAANPSDRMALMGPGVTSMHFTNIVTAYKMVVSDDGSTYESFIQKRHTPTWLPHRQGKTLTGDILRLEVEGGHLTPEPPRPAP